MPRFGTMPAFRCVFLTDRFTLSSLYIRMGQACLSGEQHVPHLDQVGARAKGGMGKVGRVRIEEARCYHLSLTVPCLQTMVTVTSN